MCLRLNSSCSLSYILMSVGACGAHWPWTLDMSKRRHVGQANMSIYSSLRRHPTILSVEGSMAHYNKKKAEKANLAPDQRPVVRIWRFGALLAFVMVNFIFKGLEAWQPWGKYLTSPGHIDTCRFAMNFIIRQKTWSDVVYIRLGCIGYSELRQVTAPDA